MRRLALVSLLALGPVTGLCVGWMYLAHQKGRPAQFVAALSLLVSFWLLAPLMLGWAMNHLHALRPHG